VQDGDGKFVIFDVQGEHGFSFVARQQAVGKINVGFRDHQSVQALEQAGAGLAQGDDHELAGGVRDAFFDEQLFRGFRVGDDQAGDRGIPRVLNAQADHFDGIGAQQFDHGSQSSHTVGEHD